MTTTGEAMDAVHTGHPVQCTREEYLPQAGVGIRGILDLYYWQRMAVGDWDRATYALLEVDRLDLLFDYDPEKDD